MRNDIDICVSQRIAKQKDMKDNTEYNISYGDDAINFISPQDLEILYEKIGEFLLRKKD